jgi:hypothetical protein
MSSRSAVALASVLRACKPLVRLLVRHGVAYPAFASALKQVFLEASVDELRSAGKKQTDSALSLLSGVHRRDIRELAQRGGASLAMEAPMNVAGQVASRWLTDPAYLDKKGRPLVLARAGKEPSFDALVTAISVDVRPKAVLDDMLRLGMLEESDKGLKVLPLGIVPKEGFAEMASLLADNLHDHAAAASLNVDGGRNYLEQAVFVDQLTAESAHHLHTIGARAWRQAFQSVMREAQARFDHDQAHATPQQRIHRVRFGGYFFSCDPDDQPS